jgi:hypothetical protein
VLSRRVVDPVPPDPNRPFDAVGAILSAVGTLAAATLLPRTLDASAQPSTTPAIGRAAEHV